MQPSSLIFLVIIGIWAAFFVQYWVRRREHLATIRSVDAFSQTMRVLERRAPLPSVSDGGRSPRAYAVSPARAMRPQVTVKRAEATTMAYAAEQVDAVAPAAQPVTSTRSIRSTSAPSAPSAPAVREVVAMRPGRATRGIVLLVGALGTVVFGALAAVGVLLWWAFVVPLLMAVAGFAWLRSGVQAEIRAARAARTRAQRPGAQRDVSQRASTERAAEPAPSVEDAGASVVAAAPYDVSAVDAAPVSAETTLDVDADVTETEVVPQLDEDDLPLTWDPRPVPRPTYTMKARAADRPVATPPVEAEVEVDPGYFAEGDDIPQRFIANG